MGDRREKNATQEQRFAPRRARRLPALLEIEGAAGPLSCFIVDISTTGAKVLLAPGWQSATSCLFGRNMRVSLYERVEKVRYDCVIVRMSAGQVALKFSAPPVLPAIAGPRASQRQSA